MAQWQWTWEQEQEVTRQSQKHTTYLDVLAALPPPVVSFAVCDLSAVPRLFSARALTIEGCAVRVLHGERCLSPGELHQEWGEAWQFPAHLSHRWAAFAGEITDMDWLHARNYLTVITQSHRFYEDSSTHDLAALGALLETTAMYWADPPLKPRTWHPAPTPFHVVFQCEPKYAAKTRARFRSAVIAARDLFAET